MIITSKNRSQIGPKRLGSNRIGRTGPGCRSPLANTQNDGKEFLAIFARNSLGTLIVILKEKQSLH
jgi:hypothetical protein